MRDTVQKHNNQNIDAVKYMGITVEILDYLAAEMKECGLHDEADMIGQTMGHIWESAQEKCAHILIKTLETKGDVLNEVDKEFARLLCKLTPEDHGHIASLVKRAL